MCLSLLRLMLLRQVEFAKSQFSEASPSPIYPTGLALSLNPSISILISLQLFYSILQSRSQVACCPSSRLLYRLPPHASIVTNNLPRKYSTSTSGNSMLILVPRHSHPLQAPIPSSNCGYHRLQQALPDFPMAPGSNFCCCPNLMPTVYTFADKGPKVRMCHFVHQGTYHFQKGPLTVRMASLVCLDPNQDGAFHVCLTGHRTSISRVTGPTGQ